MPRVSRKDLQTPFLHVMVQGVNKEYIFKNEEYIEEYLNIIEQKKENYNFLILAYCMMSNHAHFLIYTENVEEFGKFNDSIILFRSCYKTSLRDSSPKGQKEDVLFESYKNKKTKDIQNKCNTGICSNNRNSNQFI